MAKKPYPSEVADRFQVRMPDGLRDRIAEAAKASGRSMNSEIVHRLEGSFPSSDAKPIEGRRPTKAEVDAALRILEHLKYYAHEVLVDEDVMAKGKK
ncbi:MAG: hypothetical protein RLZZ129_1099 [Verrucomicrobiota bacterium]|jgi:hypothetical protein